MWTYPILITLLCVCGAKRYLQQESRLHYQSDMDLFLILLLLFFFFFEKVFLILVDCSNNPFDVLSPPRQKEGYVEENVYYHNNVHNFCHNLFMWQVVSCRNKILDSYESIISSLTNCHIVKLWQSCKTSCGTRPNL